MIGRLSQGPLTWIDMVSPSADEVREMLEELDIKPHLATDLTAPGSRTGAEATDKTLKLIMRFPIVKRTDIKRPHEVTFLATKTHLVTVRYETMEAMHRFKKEFEVLSILKKPGASATAADILLALLGHLFDGLHKKLDYLDGKIDVIDGEMHAEKEREMVKEISRVNRRIIAFRHTLQTYEHTLSDLNSAITKPFGPTYVPKVKELSRQYQQVVRRLRAISDTVDELRDTNIGILTTKQNEVMKILTIMAFITFPLTLFTSLFGMNTHTTPLVGRPGDFWIILTIMFVVSIGFFAYFKYKKWM